MGGVQRVDEVEEEDANARKGSDVSVWQQMDDAGCKLKVTVTLTCVERVGLCPLPLSLINHKTMAHGCCPIVNGQMVGLIFLFLFFCCARDLIRVQQSSAAHHMTASPGWDGRVFTLQLSYLADYCSRGLDFFPAAPVSEFLRVSLSCKNKYFF